MTKVVDRGFLENYKYVFDPSGEYGGNQKLPVLAPARYAHIVKTYHYDLKDDKVRERLDLFRTEGCGYVALINTVFLRFYGEEEKFKKLFGFPMYTPEGKLNFNDLNVDFYCATDNHNKCLWFDLIYADEDKGCKEGFGTTLDSREWRFELYMKRHNVSVDVVDLKGRPADIEECMKKGPLIVAVRPTIIYDKKGKVVFESTNGHAMTVTGITPDGLIRVSSWGEEHYVKPGSYKEHENYQQVIYRR